MSLPANPQAWAQASLEYARANGIDPTTIDPANPDTQNAVIHFQATRTATAIQSVEGAHGSPTRRSPDKGFGLYQYEPKTWAKASLAYAEKHNIDPTTLDPNDPKVQQAVAYNQISGWLKEGYTPKQVASMWNSGHPDPKAAGTGVNKFGVKYDAPGYVKKFDAAYQKSNGDLKVPQIPHAPGQPVKIGSNRNPEAGSSPDAEISSVPRGAPGWAHNHPDLYWHVVDLVSNSRMATDTGALLLGGEEGAKIGATLGSAEPGLGTAIGGLTGGVLGGAIAYAAKTYGEDAVRQYLGVAPGTTQARDRVEMVRNLMDGASQQMGGELLGKAAGVGLEKLSTLAGPFTEAGANALQKRAGATIDQMTGRGDVYAENQAEAQGVANAIPGYSPSIGEMRNDPGLLKLQRGLQRTVGPASDTMAQEQASNNQAIQDYLRQHFAGMEGVDTVLSTLQQQKAQLEQASSAASGKVGEAVENLRGVEPQESGGAAREALEGAKGTAKAQASGMYQALPNAPLSVNNTASSVQKVESEFRPGEESVYPSSAVSRIKEALPARQAPVFVTDPQSGLTVAKTPEPREVGFQDLHSLRKDIGRQLRSAESGAAPNLELSRRLKILQNGIDADIEAGMGADNEYVQARKAYGDYINRFRKGKVGEVLRPGMETTGYRTPTAAVTKRFWTPDGADNLINAIGKEKASSIMEGHAVNDLETSGIIDRNTGEVNGTRLKAWAYRNRSVLGKYGLSDSFKSVQAAQATLDAARAEEKAFGKSVAAKMLNADPSQAVARAFEGAAGVNSKNTGQIMKDLMDRLQGNKDAIKGLKSAYKDFLIGKAETTAKDIAGESVISHASFTKAMAKYDEATKILYADEPQKLSALQRVQKAIEISNRSKFSPSGSGSDTAENLAVQKATDSVIGFIGKKLGGGFFLSGLVKHGGDAIKYLSRNQINKILATALYDPDAAASLVAISKGYIKKAAVPSQLTKILTVGGEEALGQQFSR